jgi:hypothetical protein
MVRLAEMGMVEEQVEEHLGGYLDLVSTCYCILEVLVLVGRFEDIDRVDHQECIASALLLPNLLGQIRLALLLALVVC